MSRKLRMTFAVARILVAALLLFQAGCAGSPAETTAEEPEVQGEMEATEASDAAQRVVNVSGSGEVESTPDRAVVTIGVQTEAEEASAALSQNSEQMQGVIDALQQAGVAPEDLQTQVVQLRPRYEQPGPPEPGQEIGAPELVGYVAVNAVEVLVRELDTLGELLDTAVRAGGNRIEGIRFEIGDPAEALDRAREAAWSDARHKADQLAALAGAELGDVLSINETSSRPFPVAREFAVEEPAAVPIEPGTQTVEVNLQVEWALR